LISKEHHMKAIPATALAFAALASPAPLFAQDAPDAWTIDSQEAWESAAHQTPGLDVADGLVSPTDKQGRFTSAVKRFNKKRKAASVTFVQSPIWQNWEPIDNLGPSNLQDAPVFLSLGPNNYWAFGRYGGKKPAGFRPASAELGGFNVPLQTTPFPTQYDAPGGLEKPTGGYHAWQSKDMVNWVHHGPVTEGFSRWVTSAEYADGTVYIYYDFPNDQDPHVYADDNLFDGQPGKNLGMAFKDPSHGSDAGFIRDLDGNFHVIYEDWSPINASKRSWDSPLAGHAVSQTPAGGYTILDPAVDNRTEPTGETATYRHPHWVKEDPANYKTNVAEYQVHAPEQEAYGDWAAIAIGGQYYLFGDYDPVGGHQMSVGWFTTSDLNKPFTWCDKIGRGHPDPDVGFAEGRFYLFTQQKTDYVSPGPWVEKVEARLGVDTDNDGETDRWTDWQRVNETYDYTEGFAKQIAKTPATLDASKLPAGFGFQVEFKLTDTTENKSKPMIDRVTVTFE
jgi:hypothetical protein